MALRSLKTDYSGCVAEIRRRFKMLNGAFQTLTNVLRIRRYSLEAKTIILNLHEISTIFFLEELNLFFTGRFIYVDGIDE